MTTYLFDVDGTLCKPRERIHPDCLAALLPRQDWALTSGSDYHLIAEQILLPLREAGWRGRTWVYGSGGGIELMVDSHDDSLSAHLLGTASLASYIGGSERLMAAIREVLADHPLPAALMPPQGFNTVLDRSSLWNVVPIGRPTELAVSKGELVRRAAFVTHDHLTNYRQVLRGRLAELCLRINGDLRVRLGGQTGLDIQIHGLDKSHAAKRCLERGPVVFIGDSFGPHGNDQPVMDLQRRDAKYPLVVMETDGPETTAALLRLKSNWGQMA